MLIKMLKNKIEIVPTIWRCFLCFIAVDLKSTQYQVPELCLKKKQSFGNSSELLFLNLA